MSIFVTKQDICVGFSIFVLKEKWKRQDIFKFVYLHRSSTRDQLIYCSSLTTFGIPNLRRVVEDSFRTTLSNIESTQIEDMVYKNTVLTKSHTLYIITISIWNSKIRIILALYSSQEGTTLFKGLLFIMELTD